MTLIRNGLLADLWVKNGLGDIYKSLAEDDSEDEAEGPPQAAPSTPREDCLACKRDRLEKQICLLEQEQNPNLSFVSNLYRSIFGRYAAWMAIGNPALSHEIRLQKELCELREKIIVLNLKILLGK